MSDISMTVDKAEERRLLRNIGLLPELVFKKVVGSAASRAMTPVLRAARQKCPVGASGMLKKSLGKKRKTYKRAGVVWVGVGPRKGFKTLKKSREGVAFGAPAKDVTDQYPARYAHLVELGTSPHVISGNPKLTIGPVVIAGAVQHPGSRPQPFLRPALFEQAPQVVSTYRGRLLVGVERETKRLGGRP